MIRFVARMENAYQHRFSSCDSPITDTFTALVSNGSIGECPTTAVERCSQPFPNREIT